MGNVVFLGVEGSGKTTLAMALAKAFARHADEGWYLRPGGRGAYNFATVAPDDFAVDGFPAQTSAAREMTWTISRDGADVGGIRILDYPGEIYRLAFLKAEDEVDPDAFRARAEANAEELDVLNRAIEEAESLYVLFNLQDALDLRGDDSNRSAVWVTNECLKRLKSLPSKPRVTLVFTQVDRYQTEDDFLHSFTPAELDLIGHDHPDVDWMMVSVLVPPDSEFGIDAFVRRVTGLGGFGVPDGRPRQRPAAGGALARLAAQRKSSATVTTGSLPVESTGTTGVPPVGAAHPDGEKLVSFLRKYRRFLWMALILAIASLLAYWGLRQFDGRKLRRWWNRTFASRKTSESSVDQHSDATRAPRPQETPPSSREGRAPARPDDDAATNSAPPAIANAVPPVASNAVPVVAATNVASSVTVTNAAPVASTNAAPVASTNVVSVAAATNAAPVVSVQMALSNETAIVLAAARKCGTLLEAREILTYAVDTLNSAEAIYERARVDDFLGWGAFVRTREEKASNPPWPEWQRRIDLLGEKKAIVMMYPLTGNNAHIAYRTQALEGYRAAAARGLPAAVDALARHANHENNKDVRRSGKTPSAPPVSLSPATQPEAK